MKSIAQRRPPVHGDAPIDPASLRVPRVGEWVWRDPQTGTTSAPPPPPPPAEKNGQSSKRVRYVRSYSSSGWGGWWIFIVVFFLLLLILGLSAYPGWYHGRGYYYHRPPPPPAPLMRGYGQCADDETFDRTTELCMMNSHYPSAVSRDIMDSEADPCNDFYRHACGKWIDQHLNANRGFSGLAASNQAVVAAIIRNASVASLHPLYESCRATLVNPRSARSRRVAHLTDTRLAREAILGRMLNPLVSVADLPVVFARMAAAGFTVPVSLVMQGHPREPGLVPMFAYDGFEGRDLDPDYVRHHFEMLYGEHSKRAKREAGRLIAMANRLAAHRPDPEGRLDSLEGWRDYVSTGYGRDSMTWRDFRQLSASRFNWKAYVAELQKRADEETAMPAVSDEDRVDLRLSDSQEVWAFSRAYFEWWHPEMFTVDDWRIYTTFSVLYHTHDFFPQLKQPVLFQEHLHGMVRPRRLRKERLSRQHYRWSGTLATAQSAPDESVITDDDCLRAARFLLPGALSARFLEQRFAGERGERIRQRVTRMVERIRGRMVANLQDTPWLQANATARRAQIEKVRNIVPRVVHPTQWTEERFPLGREMDPVRYLRNILIVQSEHVRRNLALWADTNYGAACSTSECRDRITLFGAPLYTVNAWYSPDRNVITVPAGILQPPFFHEQYTEASAYGTLGWVLAHELSHSLDPHGVMFDRHGVMRDTWGPRLMTEYRKRVSCVVREYDSALAQCHIDHYGEQTKCEDIADVNGMRIAYEALFHGDKEDAEARKEFFLAGGQMWCSSMDEQHLCDRAGGDVHAQAADRVRKTMAHLPYFAGTFGCPAGSPMHRTPAKRCVFFGPEAR